MTADQRLNQLEPMLAESIAQGDRHAAQLTQLRNMVGQVAESSAQQSDNMAFALRELAAVREEQAQAKVRDDVQDEKLDRILNFLAGKK